MFDFKEKLLNRSTLIGTMLTLNSPELIEIILKLGFDWLFIDAEHAPFQFESIQRLIQTAGKDLPCIIRLADDRRTSIQKALDIGAAGIIVPMVNTAKQASEIVKYAKYSPLGERGVGITRAHSYGLNFQETIDNANDRISIIIQAEHIDSVKNISEILEVQGIDAVFVGPYDLSASMGKTGKLDDPEVLEAIEHISKACDKKGMTKGIFGISVASLEPHILKGFTLLVAGVDTLIFGKGARELLDEVRNIPRD